MRELMKIQSELKAPKGQFNQFGKYKYRSAEDVLEALKPLLLENGCILTLTDEVVMVGERYYVKANAVITNDERMSVEVSAYAREELEKKGMDGAQITGSASSYARKYALNGLFCIDDTKDPDFTNRHGQDSDPYANVANCKTVEELQEIWTSNPKLHGVTKFKNAVNAKKQELS